MTTSILILSTVVVICLVAELWWRKGDKDDK